MHGASRMRCGPRFHRPRLSAGRYAADVAGERLFDDLLPQEGFSGALRKRPSGFGSLRHIIRIALAATIAFVIATHLSQSTLGIFAPMTTLLVVQSSPWSTLGISVQRIIGTGLGVLAASLWVNLLGLTWWSFLGGVFLSLLIARKLPFSIGGQIQIPIAVIFVLAIGPNSIEQDLWRVLDVGIGGVIGIAAVLIWPPRPPIQKVLVTLADYRDDIVGVLRAIADETGQEQLTRIHDYVARARSLRENALAARDQLADLSESTHANMRAGQVRSQLPSLALTVRRLMGFAIQVRGLAGACDALYDRREPPALSPPALQALIADLTALVDDAMGAEGTPIILAGKTPEIDTKPFAQRIRTLASDVVSEHGDVASTLESVALLGRFDYLRAQVGAYGSGEHIFDEEL